MKVCLLVSILILLPFAQFAVVFDAGQLIFFFLVLKTETAETCSVARQWLSQSLARGAEQASHVADREPTRLDLCSPTG